MLPYLFLHYVVKTSNHLHKQYKIIDWFYTVPHKISRRNEKGRTEKLDLFGCLTTRRDWYENAYSPSLPGEPQAGTTECDLSWIRLDPLAGRMTLILCVQASKATFRAVYKNKQRNKGIRLSRILTTVWYEESRILATVGYEGSSTFPWQEGSSISVTKDPRSE